MKKLILFLLLVILIAGGIVAYRALKPATSDKDGNQIRYTLEEVEEKDVTGIFVHNADDTFSPAIRQMPNYQGETDKASPDRYVWYTEKNEEVSKLVPTITEGAELVAIFNMDGDLADSHYLEKYKFKGYTIGAHVYMESDKTIILSSEDPLPGSQAQGALSGISKNTDDIYEVSEISGSDALPINNIDNNMSLLLGLQENKLYRFRYYHGTKEDEITFQADAKVFQSQQWIPISTPYRKTDRGYFIINLPEDLPNGYYYISDMGFFAVNK